MYEFHDRFTRRLHGCLTVDDYYRKISSIQNFKNISVPLLCLSAEDDPIANGLS
jgi:predicted alpha/beta-fold hydrolase